jgi:hypothetical protein
MSEQVDHMAHWKAQGKTPQGLRQWADAIGERVELRCGYSQCVIRSAADEMEQLQKALALKMDAMPSGLTAGQSVVLEKRVAKLEQALKVIAAYDEQSIWNDDRDDAANAMLERGYEFIRRLRDFDGGHHRTG